MADLSSIVKKDYVEGDEKYYFDTIPMWKFIFLTIVTFGLYHIIWIYKLWKRLSNNFGYDISPFWRTAFAIATCFTLFPLLGKYVKAYCLSSFPGLLFAILYLILNFTNKLPDPYSYLVFFALIIPTVIQLKLNRVNVQNFPNAEVNGWNIYNTLWSIPFVLFWVLFIIGTIFPE